MDSTVTGPITSFSRTCKPASMISKCVTPGIGKSANNINEKQINKYFLDINGGFQLEFVSISRIINHMTCYKFEFSHWLKLQHSDWRANLVKDLFKIDFPPMRAVEIIAFRLKSF